MINTLSSTQLLNFCRPPPPCSTVNEVVLEGCLGSNMSLVFVWEFHVTDAQRATRAREQRGRSQTSGLFLFVEIQKWSCYPGGGSCFPYSSATWQASAGAVSHRIAPLPPLLASHSSLPPGSPHPLPSSLYPSTILLSPQAGKRLWPAMETA